MGSSHSLQVPLADPVADNRTLACELEAAAARVISKGPYILGPEVGAFETAFARMMGGVGAVGTASGTDALSLALLGAGVEPGDEVIVPSHTAGPSVAAIRMIGAVPVLVDVEAESANISPRAVEMAVGPRVKAVMAVHLYGRPADLDTIMEICNEAGLALVEDCAQAAGAALGARRVGSVGTAGCFSFYPTKNLGALGDGGCVVSSDEALIERVRALRTYGWKQPQHAEIEHGRCSRLDELQAALLSVKLPLLDRWNARRQAVAARYLEAFQDLPLVVPIAPAESSHVYHLFVVRSEHRDALQTHLQSKGIGTGRHYPLPIHRQPGLATGARVAGSLSVTELICDQILTLPLYYSIEDEAVEYVIHAVRSFLMS